MHLFATPV